MDLNRWLLRAAARRPHVLTVTEPGGTRVRLAVEDALARRGWPPAMTPADADILLVAGRPGPLPPDVLENVWTAIPSPRIRVRVIQPAEVAGVLDAAARRLVEDPQQQDQGAEVGQHGNAASERDHQSLTDSSDDGEGDMPGMQPPGGLQMADRADDRDGLKLDQLHVFLGPALPDWPSGLVLRVALQGDVVQDAVMDTVGLAYAEHSYWTEPWQLAAAGEPVSVALASRRRVGAHLDSLGRLLAVAGWLDAAAVARRLRDATLGGLAASQLQPQLRRFTARVARSRTLAWSTRGLGVLGAEAAAAAGVSGPALHAAGDVTVRYRGWCGDIVDVCGRFEDDSPLMSASLEPPRGPSDGAVGGSAALVGVLPGLLMGSELAAARLILASLDPDLDELTVALEHVGGQ
jgi:hypothetical protein